MQFWKMNGAGNDFIILNNLEERLPPSAFPLLARTLCTPHRSTVFSRTWSGPVGS